MSHRSSLGLSFAIPLALCLATSVAPICALAQDDAPVKHGRKYKAPPDTSHIEVDVVKGFNKKPIMNAAVVFHAIKDGVDEGNLEVKTDPDGKAIIDVIATGSKVSVQVIADGFATFAQDYDITEPTRTILVSMIRPRAQISTYVDNTGKASQRQPGIQEPAPPKTPAPTTPAPATTTPPATTTTQPN
jgi:hypothetical protein